MICGLPERLQQLRHKYGYSQKQVAEKINVSPSIVSAYETGERTPSTDVLLSLSNLYYCSTDYLLGKSSSAPQIIDTSALDDKQIHAIQQLISSFVDAKK